MKKYMLVILFLAVLVLTGCKKNYEDIIDKQVDVTPVAIPDNSVTGKPDATVTPTAEPTATPTPTPVPYDELHINEDLPDDRVGEAISHLIENGSSEGCYSWSGEGVDIAGSCSYKNSDGDLYVLYIPVNGEFLTLSESEASGGVSQVNYCYTTDGIRRIYTPTDENETAYTLYEYTQTDTELGQKFEASLMSRDALVNAVSMCSGFEKISDGIYTGGTSVKGIPLYQWFSRTPVSGYESDSYNISVTITLDKAKDGNGSYYNITEAELTFTTSSDLSGIDLSDPDAIANIDWTSLSKTVLTYRQSTPAMLERTYISENEVRAKTN